MFRFGKLASKAVSVMSYLAERYGDGTVAISSAEVGKARGIPPALASKLLSQIATAGLTVSATGPGGGYRLARPPHTIRLSEIVRLYEREAESLPCPFGTGWCGNGPQCPLHGSLLELQTRGAAFLENTTLDVFAASQPAKTTGQGRKSGPGRDPDSTGRQQR